MLDFSNSEIYPVMLQLNKQVIYLAFVVDEDDDERSRLAVQGDRRLVAANTAQELEKMLRELSGIGETTKPLFADDPASIVLDGLTPLPRRAIDTELARALWDGWSLLDDIAFSIGKPLRYRGRVANELLDKLFVAMNLESLDQSGDDYTARFDRYERRKLQQMISSGIDRLRLALPQSM